VNASFIDEIRPSLSAAIFSVAGSTATPSCLRLRTFPSIASVIEESARDGSTPRIAERDPASFSRLIVMPAAVDWPMPRFRKRIPNRADVASASSALIPSFDATVSPNLTRTSDASRPNDALMTSADFWTDAALSVTSFTSLTPIAAPKPIPSAEPRFRMCFLRNPTSSPALAAESPTASFAATVARVAICAAIRASSDPLTAAAPISV
jgi:hypothetical protein